jgi:hypothetical protein
VILVLIAAVTFVGLMAAIAIVPPSWIPPLLIAAGFGCLALLGIWLGEDEDFRSW